MRTIRHFIDQQAAERPDEVFLVAPETGVTVTFGQLQAGARALTQRLLARGLRRGETVAFMLPNGPQAAMLLLGVMYGGFVVAPINLLSQGALLSYVLDFSESRVVFVSPCQRSAFQAALPGVGRELEVVEVDPDAVVEATDAAPLAELPAVGEDDDALLMFTSGTTGQPKGVPLTHGNVVSGGMFTVQAHALTAADRVMAVLPLYHINGQIVTMVAPLVSGGSAILPRKFSASNYWQTASRERATWLNFVPTIVSYLLAGLDPRAEGVDVSRLRFARSASAPLPPDLHRAFEERFGIGIIETMGMTETCAPCFTNPLDPAGRKIGSPGQAFGNEAKVVDLEGREVPDGTPGELCVRGENVTRGYLKNPEANAKSYYPGDWLRTGDLGYRDADGFYFITGRLKELIIKGGENIAPREIDEALLRHPAVLEAAATGMPDPHYGQEILACVILKEEARVTEAELQTFARTELGRFKTPKIVRIVRELPRGPSGKVQRLKLVEVLKDAETRAS